MMPQATNDITISSRQSFKHSTSSRTMSAPAACKCEGLNCQNTFIDRCDHCPLALCKSCLDDHPFRVDTDSIPTNSTFFAGGRGNWSHILVQHFCLVVGLVLDDLFFLAVIDIYFLVVGQQYSFASRAKGNCACCKEEKGFFCCARPWADKEFLFCWSKCSSAEFLFSVIDHIQVDIVVGVVFFQEVWWEAASQFEEHWIVQYLQAGCREKWKHQFRCWVR